MKFLMINIGVGLVQAVALTLAAPLLLGIVFRLARIGRPGPADGLLFLYERLGAARFHNLSLGPTLEFVCVFLAASMLPGFLGAKITFGDFPLLTALLGMAALAAALYGEEDGGSGVPQKQVLFEAGLFCAALFLAIACRGFHAMSTMLPDAAFQFRGTYLTGYTELAALGFFSLLAAEGEGDLRYFTGTRPEAMTFWGALARLLRTVVLLMLCAELFLPVPLPSGPRALVTAVLLAAVLAVLGHFRLYARRILLTAAPVLLFLSILAQ